MKRQWLGDDHDVRKFCLLKFLCESLNTGVFINWMQTDPMDKSKGYGDDGINKIYQLLVDYKKKHMTDTRCLWSFEEECFPLILDKKNECDFYTECVPIDNEGRKEWWNKFLKKYNTNEKEIKLVYLDPDTGIDPFDTSNPKKATNTNLVKEHHPEAVHISISEIQQISADYILIYQHTTMGSIEERKESLKHKMEALCKNTDTGNLKALCFLGGYNPQKESWSEAYILLLKNDISKKIKKDFKAKSFNQSFLVIWSIECPIQSKTN